MTTRIGRVYNFDAVLIVASEGVFLWVQEGMQLQSSPCDIGGVCGSVRPNLSAP